MSEYRQKLQALLRELFQFDSADLDFGIYAVMNHKRDQVERFIERDLLDVIEEGLKIETEAMRAGAQASFEEARTTLIKAAGDGALDAQGNVAPDIRTLIVPGIRQPVERYEGAKAALEAVRLSEEMEAQVYNDLYRFFSRYYDDGDFISQRRYGAADKYAIPYNGEEVTLYWANADQYYVKSGQYFTDYRFTLDGALGFEPATIAFKLRAASVEQNNVTGEKRFFLLAAGDAVQWDGNGRTLTVAFEYRPLAEDEKKRLGVQKPQEKLTAEAGPAILDAVPDPLVRERLGRLEGEKGKTVLARQVARYTARNTRDYFIHKDLRGFLARELDYFLKSEVLNLDDVDWARPDRVGLTAARLQTIRQIAGKIIAFLAQIEDFQKRLWEKRKFVVQSDYCIALDRVPEALYPEIAASERQRAEWARLYSVELGPDADLREYPYMMVDSALFDADFRARLLASFDDLDAACDGLLVHSENLQALRLLQARYHSAVECVHIDPPYNTQTSGFLYRNEYQHSNWLAMMADRLQTSITCLTPTASLLCHIDENEYERLQLLASRLDTSNAGTIVWDKRNPMLGRKGVATQHEYVVWLTFREGSLYLRNANQRLIVATSQSLVQKHGGVTQEAREEFAKWVATYPGLTGGERANRFIDDDGRVYQSVGMGAPEPRTDPKFHVPLCHPVTGKPCPVPSNGWSRAPETLQDLIKKNEIIFGETETVQPRRKVFLTKDSQRQVSSVIQDAGRGKADMDNLGLEFPYCHPLSLYVELVGAAASSRDAVVMDFFAGSGTTGHAVMQLNREDDSNRQYVLVEMADYFDTILKARIQKVAYAADWRDGKPVPGSPGQSHIFHYIRLESYEDTLNNLCFRELEEPLLGKLHEMPDYFLHYMLEFETQGSPSLLDARQFERPFDYRLEITRGGVKAPQPVDLVTTFNFLLGLRVRTIRRFQRDGAPVVRVMGEEAGGRRVCVLWRDVPPPEAMEAEKAWLQAHVLGDVQHDLLYVNGESALPGALPIEPEFHRLMFAEVA